MKELCRYGVVKEIFLANTSAVTIGQADTLENIVVSARHGNRKSPLGTSQPIAIS